MRFFFIGYIQPLSPLIACLTIVIVIYLRVRSFFRKPLEVSFACSLNVILLLCIFDIFLVILLYLLIKKPTINGKYSTYILQLRSFAIKPFLDLNNLLKQKFDFYGKFFNKINLIIQECLAPCYFFILILCFISIPFCLLFSTLVFECLYLNSVFYTFKLVPLLLLPLILKAILQITLDFVQFQLDQFNKEFIIEEINLQSFTDNNTDKSFGFITSTMISDFQFLDLKLMQIRRNDTHNKFLIHLNTIDLCLYKYVFSVYKQKLLSLISLVAIYAKLFSIFRYSICIFLLTYIIIFNIIYY